MLAAFISPLKLEWFAFAIYVLGMFVHTLAKAGESTATPETPWNSLREYLAKFWPKLMPQWFIGLLGFWLLWDNPAAGGLLQLPFLGDFPRVKLVMAGLFGYFSDSIMATIIFVVLHIRTKMQSDEPQQLP